MPTFSVNSALISLKGSPKWGNTVQFPKFSGLSPILQNMLATPQPPSVPHHLCSINCLTVELLRKPFPPFSFL